MEDIIRIAMVCLTGASAVLLLKKTVPELAFMLAAMIVAVIFASFAGEVQGLIAYLQELGAACNLPTEVFLPLYKTAAIGVVVKISGSLCKDAEAYALEAAVEIAGTICALLATLPLLQIVLNTLLELME